MKCWFPVVLVSIGLCGCGKKAPAPAAEGPYGEMMKRIQEERRLDDEVNQIDVAIRNFQRDVGRLPVNLGELVRLKYLESEPVPPEGMRYYYDGLRGNFRLMTVEQYEYITRMEAQQREL